MLKFADLAALEVLDLSYNEMTVSTAKALAAALTHIATLKEVRLNGNEFGESGVAALSSLDSCASSFAPLTA